MIFNLKKFAAKRIDCILLCCLKWDKLTWVVSKFKTDKFYREVRNVWEVFKIVWNYSKSRKLLATQKVFLHHIFCWYHGGHASTSTSTLKKKCCVIVEISLISGMMKCSDETKPLLWLSVEHNWWDEPISQGKTFTRHDINILLEDNACSHIAVPV